MIKTMNFLLVWTLSSMFNTNAVGHDRYKRDDDVRTHAVSLANLALSRRACTDAHDPVSMEWLASINRERGRKRTPMKDWSDCDFGVIRKVWIDGKRLERGKKQKRRLKWRMHTAIRLHTNRIMIHWNRSTNDPGTSHWLWHRCPFISLCLRWAHPILVFGASNDQFLTN